MMMMIIIIIIIVIIFLYQNRRVCDNNKTMITELYYVDILVALIFTLVLAIY